MDTKIISFYEKDFEKCVELIKNNEIVVFPTETVYGIGGNALSSEASLKIFDIKERARDNPLIVHVCDYDISKYVKNINENAVKIIERFWPGPLTIILNKKDIIPDEVTAGKDTVALRMPNNKIALELIRRSGCPIAAPSANISGRPSGTNARRCFEDLKGKVKFIIDGLESEIGIESTVISLVGDPIILRSGYITFEEIREIIPEVRFYEKINSKIINDDVLSPGLKYKHYAPKGEMLILKGDREKIGNFIKRNINNFKKLGVLCLSENFEFYKSVDEGVNVVDVGNKDDFNEIGKNLFESIRRFDDLKCDFIISECFFEDFTNAIMNRLLKASSHKVIIL